jgi:curli biogenesis system outer membrane secretion channel CsgG
VKKNITILSIILLFSVFLSGCTFTKVRKADIKKVADVNLGIMQELGVYKHLIRHNMRLTVGSFYDKTGQYKDSDRGRYSRVITQATQTMLYHILYKAFGPRMIVERTKENILTISKEYQLSHDFRQTKNGVKQIGIIQRNGPQGGITGANYLVTGNVVYYHVDRYSGGGGLSIDAIGAHIRKAVARIGVELRLVDMNTSEVIWSTLKESWVSGTLIGADIFRFITAGGEKFLVQSDVGMAWQLPADYAFEIATASAVVDMIKENKNLFLVPKVRKK